MDETRLRSWESDLEDASPVMDENIGVRRWRGFRGRLWVNVEVLSSWSFNWRSFLSSLDIMETTF